MSEKAGCELLLKDFSREFLPMSGNKRKYPHNEFYFVHKVVSRIFFQQTNENISEDVLASCLSELDYHFYVRQEDNRFYKKSKRGKARASFFDLPDDVHVYVNVSSKVVLELYKASNSMAYKKTAVAIEIITAIKKRIDFFFENKKRLAGE